MATTNLVQYLNKTGAPFELLSHIPLKIGNGRKILSLQI
jgi:hypothetical protein